jgi:glycerophosphoryl diester phosphodiesterase
MKTMAMTMLMAAAVAAAAAAAAELPQAVAHRGGSKEQVENTISALKNSYDKGVRGFEIDIYLTTDKRVVLFHDAKLERMTTGTGRVSDKSSAELAGVKMKQNGEALPYLEDVVAFLRERPDAYVQVEIKSEKDKPDAPVECARLALDILKKSGIKREQIIFISFDQNPLKELKKLDPSWRTCIVKTVADKQLIADAQAIGAEWLSVNIDNVTRAFIRDARKAGIKTTVWTVRDDADARLVMALGSDCATTDIPAAQLGQKTARP